jgi:hypothetical protein
MEGPDKSPEAESCHTFEDIRKPVWQREEKERVGKMKSEP